MSIFTEDAYGMPAQMFPTEVLLKKYPQLKISINHLSNLYEYKIDDDVVFQVHFLQNATFKLYQMIEKAIEEYIKEKTIKPTVKHKHTININDLPAAYIELTQKGSEQYYKDHPELFGSAAYHTPNKKDPVIDHLTLRVTQLEKNMADVIQHLKSMSNVFLNGGHE